MVVDVAVSMQRQVPAAPGGAQTSSSTKSWIASEGIFLAFSHRRLRQWHVQGWFPRAVLPVVVYRPQMLRIMAGMYPQDSFSFFPSSGMCKAGFAGFTLRYVFPLVVGRPAARSASWPVWTRGTFMQLAGFYW